MTLKGKEICEVSPMFALVFFNLEFVPSYREVEPDRLAASQAEEARSELVAAGGGSGQRTELDRRERCASSLGRGSPTPPILPHQLDILQFKSVWSMLRQPQIPQDCPLQTPVATPGRPLCF